MWTAPKYVRKATRQSENSMGKAIIKVIAGGMGYVEAYQSFGLPHILEDSIRKSAIKAYQKGK